MATTEQIVKRLSKLKSTLLTSGLSQRDQPLFQVINQLIDAIVASLTDVTATIDAIPTPVSLSDRTFVTTSSELVPLPNSSQIIAGAHISFDTSVFGQLRIDVLLDFLSFIVNASILTVADESANFPSSRQLLAGLNISFDDTVPHKRTVNSTASAVVTQWSVLTNSNDTNPELVFASGDVIMTHIP